ncbi:MAG TPA: hypothetical protein VN655_05235 [Pseudolabrys sp.]|nr:hypothetical protein [Pseudolabrys sp.]
MPAVHVPGLPRKPARPPVDPQIQARIRALSLKSLDIAEGILDSLQASQAQPPALPLAAARRQMIGLLGVPALCERRRCRRTRLCSGEPAHCLSVYLPVLPHELVARVLSMKAIRQKNRRR